ncbi:hypothetical protein BWQ96_08220 [Gracilariopsis chorda]|uniref:No apical meristem-associated C-terminal domain-containing protein n=1 Tax=Gracilariopsis chorda TaxID=448386 RepID=A0A2V3IJ05_9FLOR|nr:hypothetical protein BWQ96_08220 [Gracilariopsis chorda]|eukprot:PXF42052.1 hypothetical protein BWQ96_08220 [Gracilariopsis chorda]
MKTAELACTIRESFLEDYTRPKDACRGGKRGGVLDELHWDGRKAESCLKQWKKMRKECSSFHSAMKRVEAVELTGSWTSQYLDRCATAFHNLGGRVTSHLYDITCNPKYVIGKPFAYPDVYTFLSEKTIILDNCGQTENALDDGLDVHEVEQRSQPKGNNAAKDETRKATKRKKAGMDDGMEKSAADMAASVSKFEQKVIDAQLKKAEIMQRNVDLEERKLEWEMANDMFGPQSTATDEERAELETLVRRNLLRKPQRASEDAQKEHEGNQGARRFVGERAEDRNGV